MVELIHEGSVLSNQETVLGCNTSEKFDLFQNLVSFSWFYLEIFYLIKFMEKVVLIFLKLL